MEVEVSCTSKPSDPCDPSCAVAKLEIETEEGYGASLTGSYTIRLRINPKEDEIGAHLNRFTVIMQRCIIRDFRRRCFVLLE